MFSRLALKRWDKERFLRYAANRGFSNGEEIYTEVAGQLTPEHPLLCRAVLVRQLLDIAARSDDRISLLQRITSDPSDYFRQFIGSIIQQGAREMD